MHCVKLVTFFITFVLRNTISIPVNQEKYEENYQNVALKSLEGRENFSDPENNLQSHEENLIRSEYQETAQDNTEGISQCNIGQGIPYIETPVWARAPYQVSYSSDLESLGIGMGNYKGVLYPYAHPKLFASLNSQFGINSLPPVHTQYIYDFKPSLINVPEHGRSGRILRSSNDDFLAELSHDAIMNNILPTMQVPFVRYADPLLRPYSTGAYGLGKSSSLAVFPESVPCNQPILFSCSPKISYGSLTHKESPEIPQTSYSSQQPAHREEFTKNIQPKNNVDRSKNTKQSSESMSEESNE